MILRPLLLNILKTLLSDFLSSLRLLLKISHNVFLVMSSFVGPKPPVTMIISDSLIDNLIVFLISFFLSGIVSLFEIVTPRLLSFSLNHFALVSTICPDSISSPIVIILELITGFFYK